MVKISAQKQVASGLAKHEVRTEFPASCLAEASALLDQDLTADKTLSDWRELPFVTIDNPDSRDLDQAMLIEHDSSGYRLRYALADAAYFITQGSALFAEALARGSTYYTPIGAIPMLPTVLSEGLISLNPGVDRRALVFDIRLDDQARVINTAVDRALIHSQAKLSYAGVQAYLDADEADHKHALSNKPFTPSLRLLKTLGELLIERSLERDVIPFNRKEAEIYADNDTLSSRVRERYQTEKYNEQLSLICNMQGAQLLDTLFGKTDLQAIYRVHEAPLRRMQKQLTEVIKNFAQAQDDPSAWAWKKGQPLSEFVSSLPSGPEFERRVAALERQVLISNQASYFSDESGAHHALAADSYARFSSPMREVVGIYTHKELLEALSSADDSASDPSVDLTLRDAVIEAANSARRKQKSLRKGIELQAIKSLFNNDLDKQTRPKYCGTIMGFRRDKLYVSLDEFASDIKVYRKDLEAQQQTSYNFSDIEAIPENTQQPHWQLGDGVYLSVDHFDENRQQFVLMLEPPA